MLHGESYATSCKAGTARHMSRAWNRFPLGIVSCVAQLAGKRGARVGNPPDYHTEHPSLCILAPGPPIALCLSSAAIGPDFRPGAAAFRPDGGFRQDRLGGQEEGGAEVELRLRRPYRRVLYFHRDRESYVKNLPADFRGFFRDRISDEKCLSEKSLCEISRVKRVQIIQGTGETTAKFSQEIFRALEDTKF